MKCQVGSDDGKNVFQNSTTRSLSNTRGRLNKFDVEKKGAEEDAKIDQIPAKEDFFSSISKLKLNLALNDDECVGRINAICFSAHPRQKKYIVRLSDGGKSVHSSHRSSRRRRRFFFSRKKEQFFAPILAFRISRSC